MRKVPTMVRTIFLRKLLAMISSRTKSFFLRTSQECILRTGFSFGSRLAKVVKLCSPMIHLQ